MADTLLGLDYGTGGAKACIVDTQGQVLGYAFTEYPFYHDKPGWSEHDPALYWTVAGDLIRDCLAQARIDAAEIRGVAVSSALPSMVMVNSAHNPIHRAYNLMDRRATAEVEWLKTSHRRRAHPQAHRQSHRRPSNACQSAVGEKPPARDLSAHLEGADHRRLHYPQADRQRSRQLQRGRLLRRRV